VPLSLALQPRFCVLRLLRILRLVGGGEVCLPPLICDVLGLSQRRGPLLGNLLCLLHRLSLLSDVLHASQQLLLRFVRNLLKLCRVQLGGALLVEVLVVLGLDFLPLRPILLELRSLLLLFLI